jgi:LCCL domain
MDIFVPIVEDLPAEARALVEKAGVQTSKIQDKLRKDTAAIQQRADREIAELTEKSQQKVAAHIEKVLAELKPLQVAHVKEGLLDEALAIREQIKQLKTSQGGAEPDPGNLVSFQGEVGKSFWFDITGDTDGNVWGSDVYTSDSSLATAAVHAGVVRPGERKVVRVTVVSPLARYQGSTRNGVTTAPFGPYPGAYRVG